MSQLTPSVNENDHILGDEKAKVTLLEYGDFECPYCGEAYPNVKAVLMDLEKFVRFVFRHFPLAEIHPHALHAHYAAEAAGLQGKFWEMHDMLYEHQDALAEDDLIRYAQVLGLTIEQFVQDMSSEPVKTKVRNDFMSGVRSGVNGTPTFFIDGKRYDGSYEYDDLLFALEREVSRIYYDKKYTASSRDKSP